MDDPHDAFAFDRAVWRFGSRLQAAIEGVEGKTEKERHRKQEAVLKKWIPEATGPGSGRKFRDPAAEG